MATFQFDLVSPEKLLFSGEVDQVDVPGSEGDFGVFAGHAPLVAIVRPGILTIFREGRPMADAPLVEYAGPTTAVSRRWPWVRRGFSFTKVAAW